MLALVAVVAPIWREVTGRTAALTAADKVGDRKQSYFAKWLAETHVLMGLPRPPEGSVLDIVLAQKRENPAPVKRAQE